MMNVTYSGNPIVDAISTINFAGNIKPRTWNKTILTESGKVDRLAQDLLAEFVWQYRWNEIRDGETVRFVKKFSDDLYYTSYKNLQEMFGENHKSIARALVNLERLGLVQRVFRSRELTQHFTAHNVMYIKLNPLAVYRATYPDDSPIKGADAPEKPEGTAKGADVHAAPEASQAPSEYAYKGAGGSMAPQASQALCAPLENMPPQQPCRALETIQPAARSSEDAAGTQLEEVEETAGQTVWTNSTIGIDSTPDPNTSVNGGNDKTAGRSMWTKSTTPHPQNVQTLHKNTSKKHACKQPVEVNVTGSGDGAVGVNGSASADAELACLLAKLEKSFSFDFGTTFCGGDAI